MFGKEEVENARISSSENGFIVPLAVGINLISHSIMISGKFVELCGTSSLPLVVCMLES